MSEDYKDLHDYEVLHRAHLSLQSRNPALTDDEFARVLSILVEDALALRGERIQ